jgi:hypothetical protein
LRYSDRYPTEKEFQHYSQIHFNPVTHEELTEINIKMDDEERSDNYCSKSSFKVKSYFVCFKDMNYARAIHSAIIAKDEKEIKEVKESICNDQNLIEMC